MSEEATPDDFAQVDDDSECGFNSSQSEINLSRLEEYISIIKGTKPDRVSHKQHDNSEPYLVVSTLTGEERKYTPDTDGPKATPRDTIMIMDGSKSGRVFSGENGIIGSTMAAIRPEYTNPHYLRYFLESNFERLNSATKGSAVPHTDKDLLSSLEYPVYTLPEQRRIASVLYTVDQAIQKMEKIIEHTDRVKTGLAQDLIHTGTLEGETKHAWMGEIPTDWDVCEFSEIIELSQNGIYKQPDEYGGEYPIIKMGDLFSGAILELPIEEQVHLTEDEMNKYGIAEGDLVFARHTLARRGAGDCTYVPELENTTVVESNMIHVRLNSDANPLFYSQYFNSQIGVNSLKRIITRGGIESISQEDLQNLKIPVPPKVEQHDIAKLLTDFDENMAHAEKESTCLQRLKEGLMQDFLSGEVRTHDKDIELVDDVFQHG